VPVESLPTLGGKRTAMAHRGGTGRTGSCARYAQSLSQMQTRRVEVRPRGFIWLNTFWMFVANRKLWGSLIHVLRVVPKHCQVVARNA
jgi:hypothetical protein